MAGTLPSLRRSLKLLLSSPWFVGLAGTIASALIGFAVWKHDQSLLHERAALAANSIKNEVVHRIGTRVESLKYVADLWQTNPRPNRSEFEARVSLYGGPFSGYFLINWLDPTSAIVWTGPGRAGHKVVGLKMTDPLRREPWIASRDLRQIRLSRAVDLFLGGKGLLVFVPIFRGSRFYGHIQGVFRIREMLTTFLPEEMTSDDAYAISIAGEEIYRHGSFDGVPIHTEATTFFDLYGTTWAVRAGRNPATFFGRLGRLLFPLIFGFGLILTLLLARIVYLLQKTRAQSLQLVQAHDSLRQLNESLEERVAKRTFELSESQLRLQKLAEELRTSNSELEQFTSIASHDLKEPLRAISGHIQVLRRCLNDKLNEETNNSFNYVTAGVTRMRNLIDSLLAYARLGKEARKLEQIDCQSIVSDALSNLETSIRESEAKITVHPLPNLVADPVEMLQLFQNLIGNAIKYRKQSPPQIDVSAIEEDGAWLFSIRDNGIGFAMEYRDSIFENFRRLHGPTEFAGTGLGLSVSKRIVVRHRGRIWAESEVGVGSTFKFTIPKLV